MFAVSVRVSKIRVIAVSAALCIAALLMGIMSGLQSRNMPASASDDGGVCRDIIASLGWETEPAPFLSKEVSIPHTFSDVYLNYNEIQRSAGYNLEKYRDKTVILYSYRIIGYPSEQNAVMNIIVYGGEVIGGDISSAELGGFMHGLVKRSSITP